MDFLDAVDCLCVCVLWGDFSMKKNYLVLILLLVCIPLVSAYSNSSGLGSEWTFNGHGNDTFGRNNATNVTADFYSYGRLNGSAYFNNNTRDFVEVLVPVGLNPVAGFTINYWANATQRVGDQTGRVFHVNGIYSVNNIYTVAGVENETRAR